jgi:hypothetical protein
MRVIALLAAYNEERYIANCLDHLIAHGVDAYLIDNESTDNTVKIAEGYLGRGLVGIENMPRLGRHVLSEKLARKEELAFSLEADWFMHVDLDEVRLPPRSGITLAKALAEVDAAGYNAVNFLDFVFVPTQEAPNHDHRDYQTTMRSYYCFEPFELQKLNAWKRQSTPVNLQARGGHKAQFEGRRIYPIPFKQRHYHFLSVEHAIAKFVGRPYIQKEIEQGWHGWRHYLKPEMVTLPSQSELLTYTSDDELDASHPSKQHFLERVVPASVRYEQQITMLKAAIRELEAKHLAATRESKATVQTLQKRIQELETQVQSLSHIAGVASREVEVLHHSQFYKIASLYWRWRERVKQLVSGRAGK